MAENCLLLYLENVFFLSFCSFESDTDTEVIAKLVHHIHEQHPEEPFRSVVEKAIQQLEGAFACVFKSRMFPGEIVATRRGSPLIVGIKTPHGLDTDYIPVQYSADDNPKAHQHGQLSSPYLQRKKSLTMFHVDGEGDGTSEITPAKVKGKNWKFGRTFIFPKYFI